MRAIAFAFALATLAAGVLPMAPVMAAGLESGKICQVIRTCNFARGASVRGCLSSYSCRDCSFRKRATVTVNGIRRTEWRSVCTWGGS